MIVRPSPEGDLLFPTQACAEGHKIAVHHATISVSVVNLGDNVESDRDRTVSLVLQLRRNDVEFEELRLFEGEDVGEERGPSRYAC